MITESDEESQTNEIPQRQTENEMKETNDDAQEFRKWKTVAIIVVIFILLFFI